MKKQPEEIKIDRISFELGMINCFVEMIACGVKRMAISPPIPPEDYDKIADASEKIVSGFGLKSYLDRSLLITDLQSAEFTRDKWSVIYYKEDVDLQKYLALKDRKQELEESGRYTPEARREISREFMQLLSYPEDVISEKLNAEKPGSPYMLGDE